MTEPEALLALQDVDVQTMRIERQLAQMPQQEKIRTIDLASKKLASQLKAIVGQRKDAAMELEDNERAHQETLGRIEEVKLEATRRAAGFRQTRDVEAHLTALAKRQEKLEFAYEKLSNQLERAEKAEANARAIGERLLSERAAQQESYDQATSDLQAQLRLLADRRAIVVRDISPEVMARYEKASKRFDGLGVESVNLVEGEVDAPSICRVKLQLSLAEDVRRGGSIIDCPYCRRMLVIRRAARKDA
jgi:predicted  nucleic acid-binding Zn-ribbon protein